MMFQEAISKYNDNDSGSQVSVEDNASLFPIYAFNVSHHKERLRGCSAAASSHPTLGQGTVYC